MAAAGNLRWYVLYIYWSLILNEGEEPAVTQVRFQQDVSEDGVYIFHKVKVIFSHVAGGR